MNLLFAGNKKIVKGILLSILSILKNNPDEIHFYILTMDLSDLKEEYRGINDIQIQKLDQISKEVNPLNQVILRDVTEVFKNTLAENKNMNNFYTPYCLLRLLADQIDLPDKILYLDADTMILKNLRELYETNIEEYEYAACRDYMGRIFKHPRYINSGVMLLNLKKIRESRLFEETRYYVNQKKKAFPDQDALNKFVKRKKILPMKYNEQRKIKKKTVIKHFCKGIKFFPIFKIYNIKPWEIDRVHELLNIHEFDDVFLIYHKLIPLVERS